METARALPRLRRRQKDARNPAIGRMSGGKRMEKNMATHIGGFSRAHLINGVNRGMTLDRLA